MADIGIQLGQIQVTAAATPTLVYTVPVNRKAIIETIYVSNTGTSTVNFKVFYDVDGTASAVSNIILNGKISSNNSPLPFTDLKLYMPIPGGSIKAESDIINNLSITITGRETR